MFDLKLILCMKFKCVLNKNLNLMNVKLRSNYSDKRFFVHPTLKCIKEYQNLMYKYLTLHP